MLCSAEEGAFAHTVPFSLFFKELLKFEIISDPDDIDMDESLEIECQVVGSFEVDLLEVRPHNIHFFAVFVSLRSNLPIS